MEFESMGSFFPIVQGYPMTTCNARSIHGPMAPTESSKELSGSSLRSTATALTAAITAQFQSPRSVGISARCGHSLLKFLGGSLLIALAGASSFAQNPSAKPNAKIPIASFQALANSCAAVVPVSTLEAIARTESALHPYALSVNRPHQLTRRQGWTRGTITLQRQPVSLDEAVAWTKWLLDQGITVSIGLLQVNSEQAVLLHVSPDQLFDPCTNLRAGAALLSATYADTVRVHGEGFAALISALSYYNTGSPTAGLSNGYAQQVLTNANLATHQR
jgi:type IV secretion system protein VirB1